MLLSCGLGWGSHGGLRAEKAPAGFFSYRCSDGSHSTHLLRAAAHLRAQIPAHLPGRIPRAWHWLGGFLLVPMVLPKGSRLYLVAQCEADKAPRVSNKRRVTEAHFNWRLFWKFLRPHLLLLGAAVLVRSPYPRARSRPHRGGDTTTTCERTLGGLTGRAGEAVGGRE